MLERDIGDSENEGMSWSEEEALGRQFEDSTRQVFHISFMLNTRIIWYLYKPNSKYAATWPFQDKSPYLYEPENIILDKPGIQILIIIIKIIIIINVY